MSTSNTSREFWQRFAVTFDTIYDGKRNRVMQAIDRRFRSDIKGRFNQTFAVLPDLHGRTVLDVGCGSGPYIVEALRRGAARVVGIDAAPRMLEIAAARLETGRLHDRAELICGTFPDDVPPTTRADCAIVMGVMDYNADAARFLAALRGMVGERAVLSFPSRHWFRTPVRRVRYRLRDCPVYFYDHAGIGELMRHAGFEDVRIMKLPGAGMDHVAWGSAR